MLDLPPVEQPTIIVTASRAEEQASETPASVTLIEATAIERLGSPLVPDLLRLVPSVSVAISGPAGSLTQVRIRGAEANHTLLFVEGIRANDPAAGNEPRFELLNADLASRIEVVRGPQSALWGSEAIGGVVAVSGPAPGSGGTQAFAEAGSREMWRGGVRTELGNAGRGLSIGVAGQRSDGIDSFSGEGDKDGYHNLGLRAAGSYRFTPSFRLGASGFALKGKSQFDGFLPAFPFSHADTLDETRNKLAAGRLFAEIGDRQAAYALASASLLGSSNRNRVGDLPVNKTEATRRTLALEGGYRFGEHQLVAAVDSERETFAARDTAFGGFTNQDRSRRHESLTAEWRATDLGPIDAGLAVRHDVFSRFKDATSLRASVRADLGGGIFVAASYGEGIAQPTFFDLYGFFPGSFVGNPALKPESSRGSEISLRYADERLVAAVTYFRQRLKNEIATVFLPDFTSTAVNADGESKRQGVELSGTYELPGKHQLAVSYAWLDAREPDVGGELKETRRPRHSGSIGLGGSSGRFAYGVIIAYTGKRIDTDFDLSPAQRVRLDPYWLASARVAYRLSDELEAHARVANAFDADYQDAVGYRTDGRSIHAGLRFALR